MVLRHLYDPKNIFNVLVCYVAYIRINITLPLAYTYAMYIYSNDIIGIAIPIAIILIKNLMI